MSRKSKKTKPDKSQSKSSPKINPSDKPSHARRVSKVMIGFLLGATTLIGGYTAISPRISVEPPLDALDPLVRNIFILPFKLVNSGYFSIYRVSVTCTPNLFWPMSEEDKFRVKQNLPVVLMSVEVIKLAFTASKMESQERKSFICNVWNRDVSEPQTLSRAELDIEISFRPIKFLPWTSNNRFFFHTNTTEDGKFHWIEPALEDPANKSPKPGEKFLYTGQRPGELPGNK